MIFENLEFFHEGGVVMYPLLACSIISGERSMPLIV